jgi:hypothetical protein
LTEEVDKKDSWMHTITHYKYAEVFGLNWNSLSPNMMLDQGYYTGKTKSMLKASF